MTASETVVIRPDHFKVLVHVVHCNVAHFSAGRAHVLQTIDDRRDVKRAAGHFGKAFTITA